MSTSRMSHERSFTVSTIGMTNDTVKSSFLYFAFIPRNETLIHIDSILSADDLAEIDIITTRKSLINFTVANSYISRRY